MSQVILANWRQLQGVVMWEAGNTNPAFIEELARPRMKSIRPFGGLKHCG